MDITEFREQYPMYKGVSDGNLANFFYGKYYSDKMDRGEFLSKFMGKVADRVGNDGTWKSPNGQVLQGANDYDYEGYSKKYGAPDMSGGKHLTDEFKRPSHITFSKESVYSNPEHEGGEWKQEGGKWHFYASPYNVKAHGREALQRYFGDIEKDSVLHLPDELARPSAAPAKGPANALASRPLPDEMGRLVSPPALPERQQEWRQGYDYDRSNVPKEESTASLAHQAIGETVNHLAKGFTDPIRKTMGPLYGEMEGTSDDVLNATMLGMGAGWKGSVPKLKPGEVSVGLMGGTKGLGKESTKTGSAYITAQRMERAGVDMEKIRQETGWTRAPYGEGEKAEIGTVLYHSSPDVFKKGKPDFDSFWGDRDWKEDFANEFGENEYEIVLPKKAKILDLDQSSKQAKSFKDKWAEGNPNDDDLFYSEDWTDKAKVLPEIRRLGYEGAKFRGEYILTRDLVARSHTLNDMLKGQNLGKWRFEISDADARLNVTQTGKGDSDIRKAFSKNGEVPLGQLLTHAELYKAYPDFKKARVFLDDLPGGTAAQVTGKDADGNFLMTIARGEKGEYSKSLKQTLVHEINHFIQEHEGFARGGSPESVAPSLSSIKNAGDAAVEAALAKSRMEQLIKKKAPLMDIANARLDYEWKESLSKSATQKQFESRKENYLNLAGEYESRDAAFRMDLTAEERKAKQPYTSENLKPEDLIVRMEEKGAASAVTKKGEGQIPAASPKAEGRKVATGLEKLTDSELSGMGRPGEPVEFLTSLLRKGRAKGKATHGAEPKVPKQPPTFEELRAKEEAIRRDAEKQRVEKMLNAKDFREWVGLTGGVNPHDPSWKGEFYSLRYGLKGEGGRKIPAKGFRPTFWQTSARGLDERTTDAIEAGWLPKWAQDRDFYEAMKANPTTKFADAGSGADLDKLVQDQIDSDLERLYGTSDIHELERKGIYSSEDKIGAQKEAERDLAKEERISEEELSALIAQAEKEDPSFGSKAAVVPRETSDRAGTPSSKSTKIGPYTIEEVD